MTKDKPLLVNDNGYPQRACVSGVCSGHLLCGVTSGSDLLSLGTRSGAPGGLVPGWPPPCVMAPPAALHCSAFCSSFPEHLSRRTARSFLNKVFWDVVPLRQHLPSRHRRHWPPSPHGCSNVSVLTFSSIG